MPHDTGWDVPAAAAVSFDPPVSAVGVRDGDAFRDAYAAFFRGELATNLERELDNDALHRIANRLKTLSWSPTFRRYTHPASADELTGLTRLLQGYARAGASLRPTVRPDYWTHEATREWVFDTASECDDCQSQEPTIVSGTATVVVACEEHHREAHRRYVEEIRAEPVPPTPDEPFDLAERLDAEELPTDAAERLAEIADYDPHAVRPVAESLLGAFESQRGAIVVATDYLQPVTTALTHLGTIDGRVRERFVASLTDDDVAIRQASAAAIASLAWERPDALLDIDDGVVVKRLVAMLGESDRDSVAMALSALLEFARTHPHRVAPFAERIAGAIGEDGDPGRWFLAGVTLATLTRNAPELGARRANRFVWLADREGPTRFVGVLGFAYLDDAGYDVSLDVDPVPFVRSFADPTRYPERVVREAVYALGFLGGPGELEFVDWVDDCSRTDALSHTCELARDQLFVT
ncbi:hypothetical protein [Haloarchaeobius sp. TZWWS8]|uniref:hypothetical protein n=1 Tax=Haloarchaeobius sp. TZWWS8 TaxID=3446121 RepID=UPI003EC148B4